MSEITKIVAQAINDVIKEEASDYRGAGSLHMWEKFSPQWFGTYHYKIIKRATELARKKCVENKLTLGPKSDSSPGTVGVVRQKDENPCA